MAEVYRCTEQVQKQWMGVMMHENAMSREESCLEFDNICCLEGGFLMKRMGMALCAKALHHEGVWCGVALCNKAWGWCVKGYFH